MIDLLRVENLAVSFKVDGVGSIVCRRFVAGEPLVCQVRAGDTAKLTNFLVG